MQMPRFARHDSALEFFNKLLNPCRAAAFEKLLHLCLSVFICGCKGFSMKVTINGEEQQVADGLTVAAMLQHLALPADRVALERNRYILPRALWAATAVQPGDSFEIVTLVGGG
jgi:thiamine biosynthesis protein ThiS